jgi:hypothetical protein
LFLQHIQQLYHFSEIQLLTESNLHRLVILQLPVLNGGTVLCEPHLSADPCYASPSTACAKQEKEVEKYAD